MCRYKRDESIKAQEKEVNWFIQNYRANHHRFTKNKDKDSDSKRILNYRGSLNEPLMIELSDRKRKENSWVRKIHGYSVCKFSSENYVSFLTNSDTKSSNGYVRHVTYQCWTSLYQCKLKLITQDSVKGIMNLKFYVQSN